jgi:hypothetical protein
MSAASAICPIESPVTFIGRAPLAGKSQSWEEIRNSKSR